MSADDDPGLVEKYLEHVRVEKRLAQRTVELYSLDLQKLADFAAAAGVELTHVQNAHIRRWVAQMHSRGRSGRGIALILSGWRGLYTWLGREGPGQGNSLGLTSGDLVRLAGGQLDQVEALEPGRGPHARLASGGTPGAGREGDVVEDVEVGKEAVVLEDEPDGAALGRDEGVRGGIVEHLGAEADAARGDGGQAAQGSQQGRLAGAVGAQDPEHLARRDVDGHVEGEPPATHRHPDTEGDRGHGVARGRRGSHRVLPARSHRSRRPARTRIDTTSRTRDRPMAASGSLSRAR